MRITISFLVAAGVLALAACGGSKSGSDGSATTSSGPQTITIQVKGGKPVGGITHADAQKGRPIALVVHSDIADEIHLHGYDLHTDVKAGGTATIRFKADIAGVFEAELEGRKLQILELTVK
jgi:hypothetical protein